jgi:hypothetical protein
MENHSRAYHVEKAIEISPGNYRDPETLSMVDQSEAMVQATDRV